MRKAVRDHQTCCRESGLFVGKVCGYHAYLQSGIHLRKRLFRLFKESKDGSSTERALVFVIVQIQYLLEGQDIYTILELLQAS